VFVKDKFKQAYEDEQEARFVFDLEKYMTLDNPTPDELARHVRSIRIKRIRIILED
jgi:hypothetical protein